MTYAAVWDLVTTQSPTPTLFVVPSGLAFHRSSSAPLQRTRDVRCAIPPPVAPGPLAAHRGRQPGSREQRPPMRQGAKDQVSAPPHESFHHDCGGGVRVIDPGLKGMLFVGRGDCSATSDGEVTVKALIFRIEAESNRF